MNKCNPEVAGKKAIDSIVEEMREVVSLLTKTALIEGKSISPYKISRLIDHWMEELEKVTI